MGGVRRGRIVIGKGGIASGADAVSGRLGCDGPSLAEMVEKGLAVLDGYENGFVVEIDIEIFWHLISLHCWSIFRMK